MSRDVSPEADVVSVDVDVDDADDDADAVSILRFLARGGSHCELAAATA